MVYHPPYLTRVGNQLAWVGTINQLVLLETFQTVKHHFQKQESQQPPKTPLKTNYVQPQESGNVINLFGQNKKT